MRTWLRQTLNQLAGSPSTRRASRFTTLQIECLEERMVLSSSVAIDHPADGGLAYKQVNGPLFAAGGPSYLDVRQGAEGDCWLLSSLAEVAARAPADIQNMFTYNGTTVENGVTVGLYTVHLYNNSGGRVNVVVDTELPGGGSKYDHIPASGAIWAALAEKAFAQSVTANGLHDNYDALNSNFASVAMRWITGKSASDVSINTNNLGAAWNSGKLIVIDTNHPTSSLIVGDHAYAVVGYNPSSSQPFKVYNPWGTDSSGWAPGATNTKYGQFTANAAFINQNFTNQEIGTGAEGDLTVTDASPTPAGSLNTLLSSSSLTNDTGSRVSLSASANSSSTTSKGIENGQLPAVGGSTAAAIASSTDFKPHGSSHQSAQDSLWVELGSLESTTGFAAR